MPRKVVSVADLDDALGASSLLRTLAPIWAEAGYDMVVGREYHPTADVCILHHNVSVLDPERLPTPPSGVRVLNHRVLDISKRTYSTLAVGPDDPWTGPVIVKTNLNHFGIPEQRHGRAPRAPWLRRQLARVAWRAARTLPHRTYPVLDRIAAVPGWVWRRPDLLVEKFMPEREGDLFALRGWLFLGSRGYGYRLFGSQPLVKTGNMVRYEIHREAPAELHVLRERMGFDYGKFDYVVHDGRAILLDANKTPTFQGDANAPHLRELALGIEDYLA